MSSSRLNKFIALLLTANMIGGGIGIEAAAGTADDSDLITVSVDLSDHLLQFGAIPGTNEVEELNNIVPEYVSGDYEHYRSHFLHRRSRKHKNAEEPVSDRETAVQDEEENSIIVSEEQEAEEPKAEEPKNENPKEDPKEEKIAEEPAVEEIPAEEPDAGEPEVEETPAEEPAAEESESAVPEETVQTAPAADKEENVTEQATGYVPRHNTKVQLDKVTNILDLACKNWDGKSDTINADVSGLGVTVAFDSAGYMTDDCVLADTVSYFINTHGEYFFLDLKYTCSYYKNTLEVAKITLKASPDFTGSDVATFNSTVNKIMKQIDPDWSDLEKVLFIHDYIVTNCNYDEDSSNYHYDAYNCLVNGSCVCQGYSLAFDYLCRVAGIDCYYISSSSLNHAWNMVTIDGEQYFLDTTWDDPLAYGGKNLYKAHCGHTYFMLSYSGMYNAGRGHKASDWMVDSRDKAKEFGTDKKYDSNYFWSGSESRIVPISGHKWAYILTDSPDYVRQYDFANNTKSVYSDKLPTSFYYSALASHDGDVYVSTSNNIYRIGADGKPTKIYAYNGSNRIYGISISGDRLTYYIYSNYTDYISKGYVNLDPNFVQKGDNWYFLDPDGGYAKGMTVVGKDTYFFDEKTGIMVTGWKQIGTKWYYFKSYGAMATGWYKVSKKYYYFNSEGVMQTGFIKDGKYTYYCNSSGVMQTGWKTIKDKKYHFSSTGKMATGWKTISKKKYFFSEKGVMCTGFRIIGGKTYYFTSKGVMKTGWFKKSSNYYYANSKGVVYMNKWKKSGGKWYYLSSSGKMLKSCKKKISGKTYKFNSKGVCTNKK